MGTSEGAGMTSTGKGSILDVQTAVDAHLCDSRWTREDFRLAQELARKRGEGVMARIAEWTREYDAVIQYRQPAGGIGGKSRGMTQLGRSDIEKQSDRGAAHV